MRIDDSLPYARGYFEFVELIANRLNIVGWMMLPDQAFDQFFVFIDRTLVCKTPVLENQGVANAFPFIAHAGHSAFSISVTIDDHAPRELVDVCIVGVAGGVQTAMMDTYVPRQVSPDTPPVPVHLMKRVSNTESPSFFLASALKSFRDYWDRLCVHSDPTKIESMLDWGCGCGRLLRHFQTRTPIPKIHGCDIDQEAIDWCRQNIPGARFDVIPLMPPTSYPDGYFDVVIGNSVLTHLTKDAQIAWVEEMQRMIAPGGHFLASVHGEFATFFAFPSSARQILANGINDEVVDHNLATIAPADYYRGTYQSRQYTEQMFAKYFDVLDYIDRGAMNFQDLVVLRRA